MSSFPEVQPVATLTADEVAVVASYLREHVAEARYEASLAAERANPTLKALREAYRFISQPASMSGSGPVTTITYRTGRFNELSAMLRKAIAAAELGEVVS